MDAKGQGKPCGRGFIAPGKKCGTKARQQLASDLKAGDAKAKARVATGKRNAMAQQEARRQARGVAPAEQQTQPKPKRPKPKVDRFGRTPKQQYKQAKSAVRELKTRGVKGALLRQAEAEVTKLEKKFNPMVPRKKRSPESIAKGKATRARNKNIDLFGRTPKQQYKQAKSAVRELKTRGVEGAPLRQAEAEVTELEKKFNPMVPRKKRSPESIAKGRATRARNKKARG